mgnify:CR=1 FL=1
MLTGTAQYDSAFSKTKWVLSPGHTKIYIEAETVVEEMVSPIKPKRVTKFDKFRSHAVAPVISDRVRVGAGCVQANVDPFAHCVLFYHCYRKSIFKTIH